MQKLETKIVYNQPGVKPTAAIIWLHGLGADYNDFVPLVSELNLDISVKFVFPNARIMPVTINGGMQMRAWYDILDFSALHREVDNHGIATSVRQIEDLIEDLISQGFAADKIVLAGFSQGGVIGYYAGLNSRQHLAGLLILSSYLPDPALLERSHVPQKTNLAMLICHGTRDPVVNISYAKQALKSLQELGLTYQWQEYPMEHSVCAAEVSCIAQWLAQVLHK